MSTAKHTPTYDVGSSVAIAIVGVVLVILVFVIPTCVGDDWNRRWRSMYGIARVNPIAVYEQNAELNEHNGIVSVKHVDVLFADVPSLSALKT